MRSDGRFEFHCLRMMLKRFSEDLSVLVRADDYDNIWPKTHAGTEKETGA